MCYYNSINKCKLASLKDELDNKYNEFKSKNLNLNMSRGKPGSDQLEISMPLLDTLCSSSDCNTISGIDCRNYGLLCGLEEIKDLFSKIMGVDPEQVIVGGNSSLNMMFDTISCFMTKGTNDCKPWINQGKIKFICPAPGYDRHFAITQYYNIEMITVPMTKLGPDMDIIENLVKNDESIKGIWCVPKYSNPQGITYSDETVVRFAKLKPKAKDFKIFWDNAYAIHDLTDTPQKLLNIMDECLKYNSQDMVVMYCSTSKITFPGAGVAAMATSKNNLEILKERYSVQTIGHDKLNQLRHIRFLKDYNGLLKHMKLHRKILRPKFDIVLDILDKELSSLGIASWNKPNGGYFISVDVMDGCAKRTVKLCEDIGVKLTSAGATYPYGIDPKDSNIRLAPTYPPIEELKLAVSLFCICTKIAAIEKILNEESIA